MKIANIPAPGRDFTDAEIRSFVDDLESLAGGELTVSLLEGCGERAIPSLRTYLLEGVPRGIFQPRERAVEALGRLGARSVLFEYLSQKRDISDPQARFGEEAVENTAARWLGEWRTEEVYEFLKKLTERRMLSGAIEALGRFERADAADTFVRALNDDVCRRAADEALSRIAPLVKPLLLRAALPRPEAEEKPSERRRRRGVVRILSELAFTEDEWKELRPLLRDGDKEIAIIAARIALESAPQGEKERAARLLVHALGKAHWLVQIQIQDCLNRNYEQVRDVIAEELAMRRLSAHGEPLADHVVRILTVVQSTDERSRPGEGRGHGKRERNPEGQ